MTRKYPLTWFAAIALVATVGMILTLMYWQFWPQDIVETYPTPYKIVYPTNKIIKQGDVLVYELKYNKETDLVPIVYRQFVDGLVFNVSDNTSVLTQAGRGTARVQITVPETLPPGKYHLNIKAVYQLNPLRTYTDTNNTEEFTIIENSLDKN